MFETIFKIYEQIPSYLIVLLTLCSFLPLILFPIYFRKLPRDYFLRKMTTENQVIFYKRILFNFLGCGVILVGIILLFLPGQGLVMITFGFTLLEFPGKRQIVIKLFSYSKIREASDGLRRLMGVEPFIWKEDNKLYKV